MSSKEAPPGLEFRLHKHMESILLAAVVEAVALVEDLPNGESNSGGEKRLVDFPFVPPNRNSLLVRFLRLSKEN